MSRVRARAARLAPCLSLVLLLGGCISEEQEQQIGDQMAAEVNAQIPLVRDPLLRAYVTALGTAVARQSDRPDVGYRFYIIDTRMVNAFALPGGHIYLTRGLLEQASSGSELAGVLAHEIGHVAARHGIEKLQRHLRTGSLVSLLYHLLLGGVGGEPELLRHSGLQLAGVLWSANHSREDEKEADRLAVEYLSRTGVSPGGIVSLLESLLAQEVQDTSRLASWFSTHPLTSTRIVHAREEMARHRVGSPPPALERMVASYPVFLRHLAALPPPPDEPGSSP